MSRLRGENLRSIYILLFLNVAFFLLQIENQEHYVNFFAFDRTRVLVHHEWWRLLTYQFIHGGHTLFFFPPPIALFFNLILLHVFGGAMEEVIGTRHFLTIFLISVLGTAGVATLTNTPLLGTFFLSYTLIFIAATMFGNETLYMLGIIPLRVTWVAIAIACWLIYSVMAGWNQGLPALGGAALSYGYFFILYILPARRPAGYVAPRERDADVLVQSATRNVARVAAVKNALTTANDAEIDRLIALSQSEITAGVNICPPVDYKPENSDGYCIRCEGFAECTARHLRLNRPQAASS